MLYDNLQLARVYLRAWQLTCKEFYRTIVEETLEYVAREMRSPEGGFYSTQDADSKGEEGEFFVWTIEEIRSALGDEGDDVASAFIEAYAAKPGSNWGGKNVLELIGTPEQRQKLAGARARLHGARKARVHGARRA